MTESATVTRLREVYSLIEDPERWTQHAFARDIHREVVPPLREDAACWCLTGACRRVFGDDLDDSRVLCAAGDAFLSSDGSCIAKAIQAIQRRSGRGVVTDVDVENYNDRHSHTQVLAVLEEAIRIASGDEESAGFSVFYRAGQTAQGGWYWKSHRTADTTPCTVGPFGEEEEAREHALEAL